MEITEDYTKKRVQPYLLERELMRKIKDGCFSESKANKLKDRLLSATFEKLKEYKDNWNNFVK